MASEYRIIYSSSDDKTLIFDLERAEEDGWTLVSSHYVPGQWAALMKRPKPP